MSVAPDLIASVRRGGLIAPSRPLVVMFSGGRDSTCLLDLAVMIAGTEAVSVLHVNYGLRESAGAEESHCRRRCLELGVELEVRTPRAPASGNLQAWARDVRYGAAAQLAAARGADTAAGHTATDQVETILYRLASSPSRRALFGMRTRDGRLVRPLLGFTREQTGDYCRERALAFCDDQTNAGGKYARGRVRHGLVPALRAVHPAAERNVLRLAQTLREESELLDTLVDAELAGQMQIELARLRSLPRALGALIVQRLADGVHGRPTPGTTRRLDEILALCAGGRASLDLPGRVRAKVDDGVLSFAESPWKPR